jgi:hypothetical protein
MQEITLPHLYKPRSYQLTALEAFDSGFKRLIWVWHRRSGKDLTSFGAVVPREAFRRVGTYFYVLPTYSQSKKVVWDGIDKDGVRFVDRIPKEIIKSKNETDMQITLINGSVIQLIGADNIDRVVGTNPVGVVFSEFSLMKGAVWDFIRPILAENGGWALFIFTPRGMNHAWKLLQVALANPQEWFVSVLGVEDTRAISSEVLDQERKEMPQSLFDQEYNVKFIESASAVFKNVESIIDDSFEVKNTHRYRMGVDLAKANDFTVLTPFDLMTFKVGKQERFNQIDYNLQKSKIEAQYYKHFKPQIYIDSTGVGEPIYDDLRNKQLNVEPYHFTEQSRRDLLVNLALLIEQKKITIPYDEQLIAELKSFQYVVTDRGKVRMEVPEGTHDDCVMSLALAVWNIPQEPKEAHDEVLERKELLSNFDYYKGKKVTVRVLRGK